VNHHKNFLSVREIGKQTESDPVTGKRNDVTREGNCIRKVHSRGRKDRVRQEGNKKQADFDRDRGGVEKRWVEVEGGSPPGVQNSEKKGWKKRGVPAGARCLSLQGEKKIEKDKGQ